MKVLKTSMQAEEEKARKAAAFNEVKVCPECGHKMKRENIWESVNEYLRLTYRAKCPICGCIWESDAFK